MAYNILSLSRTRIITTTIISRGKWLWSRENIKGANTGNDFKTMLEGPGPCVISCFVLIHCVNCVTKTLLLFNSSVRSKQLLYFVHGQKSEQKPTCTTKRLVGFHNHFSLLTTLKLVALVTQYQQVRTQVNHLIQDIMNHTILLHHKQV